MAKYQSFQDIVDNQMVVPTQLLKNYHQLKLSETELVVLLQIHRFRTEGNGFPTPEELATHLSVSSQECSRVLRTLIQKRMLTIEQNQNEHRVLNEFYSLEPLWEKLFTVSSKPQINDKSYDENIFPLFEQEFGRPLSPFEIETINIWLDEEEQSPALIKAALREAVLMSKLNFKYIDRILREWKRKGVRTVEQAREQGRQFRQGQSPVKTSKQENKKRDISLYYNWLEEDS
ncbi:DNA replication protein DnaD [Halobacillus karajensis]|uniref:DNA replication protein DnaD n=1 Tax=Halobacillus karajensis TaxID=195088 RepID=A0A024P1T2_9BACI|nr:DnaD domain-containing protein [Halobacillus karajensis]CDQ19531.1 DNA replication protein DnaD [Halobacillus karajensis]CDQ21993.1 DNA replication protein DnaD [Halobacillus karajensis]CDQ27834.1 DNA replication protein DnaD [Halobacillus karajensis]SEH80754.1 DNA replication protein DnaD [Halobacillus karajensis]